MTRRVSPAGFVRLLVALLVLGGSASTYSPLSVDALIAAAEQKPEQKQGKATVKVWVNTASGVYHCPGTRYYGATKRGAYMTQVEAQKAGNRPAYGRVCE